MSRATRQAAKQADRDRREAIRAERCAQRGTTVPTKASADDLRSQLAAIFNRSNGENPLAAAKGYTRVTWDEATAEIGIDRVSELRGAMPDAVPYRQPDGGLTFMGAPLVFER